MSPLKATSADRETAWKVRNTMVFTAADKPAWDRGAFDTTPNIQTIARYRIASQAELLAALGEVVERSKNAKTLSAISHDVRNIASAAIAKAESVQ